MKRQSETHTDRARKTAANPLGFIAIAALGVAYLASPARAETDTTAEDGLQTVIEEIVVVAKRRPEAEATTPDASEDPLKDSILRQFREQSELEEELEWRTEPEPLTLESPQVRLGYDPRDDDRSADQSTNADLPLDVVSPATVFRIDF